MLFFLNENNRPEVSYSKIKLSLSLRVQGQDVVTIIRRKSDSCFYCRFENIDGTLLGN